MNMFFPLVLSLIVCGWFQVLSCDSETARQRWLQAVSTPTSSNPDETLYEEWDCPQVLANHTYTASQPDELSLQLGDVVNVLRKMADGLYWFLLFYFFY